MAVITDDDIALLDQKQAASKPLTDDDIARLDAQQPPKDDTPAIIKAGKNIWSGIKQSSADVQAQKTMPEMLLHLVGGAAGNLTNSLVEAAKAAYSYVPQAVKTPIENEVKGVGEAVKSNKTLSDLLLGAQQWAKDNPRAAGNIGAAVNVASVLPVGKAVEAAGKGLADVAGPAVEKAAAAIADKIPSATDKLDKAIQTGVTKGIKPTVIGKPSYDKLTNFYDKANEAVKVIAENRDKLKLVDENGEALHHPRSAAEMAQAVDQAKKVIYDKYHAMATAAGDAGSEFDTEPILKELDKVAADPEEALPMGDPRLKYNPQTRAYANDLKSEIMELHGASPDIIEARIADLNNSLKGFYDGRVTKAKAQIDGSVAKLMRQQLDDNITSAVGEGYQDLKNQYGALKTVENEVAKRALVNARKANKGVADLTDIFTGGDLVAGALSGNPALIAKGLFGRGIKEVYKSLNNPDRYIEKMFKKAYDVVPSVKDVELVKNAVAGVKPLPGPDADNPFYDLPKTKKEAAPKIITEKTPDGIDAYYNNKDNTIHVSNKLTGEEKTKKIAHEMEHFKQSQSNNLPTSKFSGFESGYVDYLSDPSEVAARAAETGEKISEIWDDVFKLRNEKLSGSAMQKPLEVEKITPATTSKVVPDKELSPHELYEWQMRRLTGFKKGDPKAVTKVEKVLRIHLKDRGNGISAESALLEKGFKGAYSNAPYTVDIPIEDNLDKINEIISNPKGKLPYHIKAGMGLQRIRYAFL